MSISYFFISTENILKIEVHFSECKGIKTGNLIYASYVLTSETPVIIKRVMKWVSKSEYITRLTLIMDS